MSTRERSTQALDLTLDPLHGHSVSQRDFRGSHVTLVFGGSESAPRIRAGMRIIRGSLNPDELPVSGSFDLRDGKILGSAGGEQLGPEMLALPAR